MSRRCELTGKKVMKGNNVSHANNKTRRCFFPNLCNLTLTSEILNRRVRFKVSAQAMRSIDHRGGLDAYMLKAKAGQLSPKAQVLQRDIKSRMASSNI